VRWTCLLFSLYFPLVGQTDDPVAYVLGPEDQISVRILQAPDLADRPLRIDLNGYIELPYVGQVKAAGETATSLKNILEKKYAEIVIDPRITISVDDYRSQPVSVLGAVNQPGVHQLRGRRTLIEVLSLAGGIKEGGGNSVKITRRMEGPPIGVPGETVDSATQLRTATVSIRPLMNGTEAQANVVILPHDTVTVPRARMVYVLGDVGHAGGFLLSERDEVSVLEALSMAGGLHPTSAPKDARILRIVDGLPQRQEVAINLRSILDGKSPDQQLKAEEILYVPVSGAKRASLRALEAMIQVGTGLAYHF
jgi:polysaccharide export outer membrane protein